MSTTLNRRLTFGLSTKADRVKAELCGPDHLAGPFNSQMPAQVAQAELRKLNVSGTWLELGRFRVECHEIDPKSTRNPLVCMPNGSRVELTTTDAPGRRRRPST